MQPVRIGVSECLLGARVRWDGGHKRDAFLTETLGAHVQFVAVCPEVEMGLGTPRETLRLERHGEDVRMVTSRTGVDHTDAMRAWAEKRVRAIAREGLCGYVLKKGSPSCGMERVRVYGASSPVRTGRGLFAEELMRRLPYLPVEEEGRLTDPVLRESFVTRVFAYHRLQAFFAGRWTVGGLVAFHGAHKLLLMAHSTVAYGSLGRLVAGAKARDRAELRAEYEQQMMDALAHLATVRRHVNVLQHVLGYFKKTLPPGDRRELADLVEQYGKGEVPLVVPLTLIRHHVRRLDVKYLAGQVYLSPHPRELMLLNHV